jgi:hypothetical protein
MMKNLLIIFILISASCTAPRVAYYERTVHDTVIVTQKAQQVQLPAYTGHSNKIQFDSLANLLRIGVPREVIEKTLIREDPETRLRVGILIDSLGNLMAVCEQQERMIEIMVDERERIITDIQKIVTQERENIYSKFINALRALLFVIIIIFLLGLAVKLYLDRREPK